MVFKEKKNTEKLSKNDQLCHKRDLGEIGTLLKTTNFRSISTTVLIMSSDLQKFYQI